MTVFKAFLHVLNKCKGMVILYTALLLLFGGINAKSGDTASQFTADKPEIVIVFTPSYQSSCFNTAPM